ncbi:hypothetical protein OC861_006610 [Tilletia horrida]|nr:hypothetical protein OC861_006610 [Tilletia horrida]
MALYGSFIYAASQWTEDEDNQSTATAGYDCRTSCNITFPQNATLNRRCNFLCGLCTNAKGNGYLPLTVDCGKRCDGDQECKSTCQFLHATCYPHGPQGGAGCPEEPLVCGQVCAERDPTDPGICTRSTWQIW